MPVILRECGLAHGRESSWESKADCNFHFETGRCNINQFYYGIALAARKIIESKRSAIFIIDDKDPGRCNFSFCLLVFEAPN